MLRMCYVCVTYVLRMCYVCVTLSDDNWNMRLSELTCSTFAYRTDYLQRFYLLYFRPTTCA